MKADSYKIAEKSNLFCLFGIGITVVGFDNGNLGMFKIAAIKFSRRDIKRLLRSLSDRNIDKNWMLWK